MCFYQLQILLIYQNENFNSACFNVNTMLDFIKNLLLEYEDTMAVIGAISVVIFVASLVLMPWILGKISTDYFISNKQHRVEIKNAWQLLIVIIKTLFGFLLLLAGIVMLVTPGQGVVAILLGLFLMEFPRKRNLELKLINNNATFKTLNWLRSKAGKPPFER